MPADRFLDTNILLYLYSEDVPDKCARARQLVKGFVIDSRLTIRNPFV